MDLGPNISQEFPSFLRAGGSGIYFDICWYMDPAAKRRRHIGLIRVVICMTWFERSQFVIIWHVLTWGSLRMLGGLIVCHVVCQKCGACQSVSNRVKGHIDPSLGVSCRVIWDLQLFHCLTAIFTQWQDFSATFGSCHGKDISSLVAKLAEKCNIYLYLHAAVQIFCSISLHHETLRSPVSLALQLAHLRAKVKVTWLNLEMHCFLLKLWCAICLVKFNNVYVRKAYQVETLQDNFIKWWFDAPSPTMVPRLARRIKTKREGKSIAIGILLGPCQRQWQKQRKDQ